MYQSRIVEEGNTFEIIKPAPVNFKEIARMVYTGQTILPEYPQKLSAFDYVEVFNQQQPEHFKGVKFYAQVLTAMAGEIVKGEVVRPPYFNEEIFAELYTEILQKLKTPIGVKKGDSFEDYLEVNGKLILPWLISKYSGAGTKRIVEMLFALRKLQLLKPGMIENKTRLWGMLKETFGYTELRPALTKQINHHLKPSPKEMDEIVIQEDLIQDYLLKLLPPLT